MTDKQPEALRLAQDLMGIFISEEIHANKAQQIAALLRTQHAEIERLNAAATDSNLILERAQAANLEMLAAIERKDALLRQALAFLDRYVQEVPLGHQPHMMALDALTFVETAKKELSQ